MLATRAGLQFSGKRKLYDVFGYPSILTSEHMLAKYQRQDITSRIVDMPPEEMWSRPPTLTELRGAKDKWDAFTSKINFWERVIQVDKLCAFGPFALLWLGMRGISEKPAPKVSSLDDIFYLQAYGADAVKIKTYEERTDDSRYGQPILYEVKVGPQGQQKTVQVHHSRVVHIVDRPLQGLMFGEPRLQQVYNVLEDLLKVGGGSAELYWLTANRGMQVDIDKSMDLAPGDAAALQDELDEFQHELRRYIRTRGVKVTPLGSEVADPRGVFEVLIATLAGTTSIPQRILTGSEAGQLASEQDRANWSEYIERRRRVFGEPYILKPTLQKLEDLGYLPEGSTEKVRFGTKESVFEWPEAFHMSPLEESNALASKGRAVSNLSRRNQFGNPIISDEEAREIIGVKREIPDNELFPKAPEKTTSQGNGGINPSQEDRPEPSRQAVDASPQTSERRPIVLQLPPPIAMERVVEKDDEGNVVRYIERPLPISVSAPTEGRQS